MNHSNGYNGIENASFLIVGASGLVGHALWQMLPPHQRHGTYRAYGTYGLVQADICDARQVSHLMRTISPSVVFLPAAMSSADACEKDPCRCWDTNVDGTKHLVRSVREHGAKLVFFSSDYVFDGTGGPYSEEDRPHPINMYGKAKLEGERIIQAELEDYLIIRLSGVYGWEWRRKNFVTATIDTLRRGKSMLLPEDQFGTPTFAPNMVDAVLELVHTNQRGVFHVAGVETSDRYAFGCLVADTFALNRSQLLPTPTSRLDQKAPRPLLCGLRVSKVQAVTGHRMMGPDEGLRLMKNAEGDQEVLPCGSSAAT
jgi:dTDP-4-dehydrorhamnose reductase